VKGNLLANPSFDAGFEGWNLLQSSGPYGFDSTNARDPGGREAGGPSYALKTVVLPGDQFRIRNMSYVPVSGNRDYHIGVYARGGSANTTLTLGIRYLSSGWSFLETHYISVTLNTASYSLFRFSSVPPPEATYANFGLRVLNSGTSNVDCWFDDAFMYEVDYPVMSALYSWTTSAGDFDFLNPGNYFRLYNVVAEYNGTSSVIIEIYQYQVGSNIFMAISLNTSNRATIINFNPPLHSLSTVRTRVYSSDVNTIVRILYNGVPNRTTLRGVV
jgi:hypothetical protein